MSHTVVHSKEPIRLFRSDVLEFFTHIHPAVVVVIWVPVIVYFFVRSLSGRPAGVSWLYVPVGLLLGLFLWTLAEYVVHRFVFHFPPHTPRQERISFLFHGVHHAQPLERSRLVMPPAASIPLALLFYGLFGLVVGLILGVGYWVYPLFSGFVLGYLIYDLTHYALHHIRLPGSYYKFLRQYHMRHHSQTPNQRYGVSSPLWDMVFGTRPDEPHAGKD